MIYTYDEYMKLHDTYILRLIIFSIMIKSYHYHDESDNDIR